MHCGKLLITKELSHLNHKRAIISVLLLNDTNCNNVTKANVNELFVGKVKCDKCVMYAYRKM